MITLTTLIINELKADLGHEPTQAEMNSLSAFMAQRNIKYLVEIELAILDWKKIFTSECGWCGDRFLNETMIHPGLDTHFCCEQCKKDYEIEHGTTSDDDIDRMCEEVGSQDFTQMVAEAVEKDKK